MELAHLHGVVFELLEQSLFTIYNDTFYRVTGCCDCINSRPIILGRFALDRGYIQGLFVVSSNANITPQLCPQQVTSKTVHIPSAMSSQAASKYILSCVVCV